MLRVESHGSVLHVTLDRPDVRNAFNDELIAKLTDVFQHVDPSTRVVLLAGEGKSFCAGGDLEWMRKAAAYSEAENERDALKLANLFEFIARCRAAVIAKVHGAAFGGGCGIVAASDFAVAETDTLFAFSEVRLGLIAGTISAYVIPKIGQGHARALFASGEAFSAQRAYEIGLIHGIGDRHHLADGLVKQLLSVGPNAVALSKQLVLDSPISKEETARRLAQARASDEGREGVAAFLERRKAAFVEEPQA